MRTKFAGEYVYVCGLNRSGLDSLRSFMERDGFKAGDGYEKDAPSGEWMCWIRKTLERDFVKHPKKFLPQSRNGNTHILNDPPDDGPPVTGRNAPTLERRGRPTRKTKT